MGAWPEFHQCCWIVPLRTAAVIIGVCSLIINLARVAGYISALVLFVTARKQRQDRFDEASLHSIISFTWYIIISVFELAVGVIILVGINKALVLRKAVSYMTMMWLLNLLISLVNASREAYLDTYINIASMFLSAYFILIIRSYHLQLEGRLEIESAYSRQLSISESILAMHNSMFPPPPPNYDEAMRCDHHRAEPANLYLDANEYPQVIANNQTTTAVLPIEEQTTVNPRRYSTQLSQQSINSRRSSNEVAAEENSNQSVGIDNVSVTNNAAGLNNCRMSSDGVECGVEHERNSLRNKT